MKNKKDMSSSIDRIRFNSRQSRFNSKVNNSESKTIKSSRKRSLNLPSQQHNNPNNKPSPEPERYHKQASESNSLGSAGKVFEEDKKTEDLKMKVRTQNQQLEQQLQLQQRLRERLIGESYSRSIDKEEEKIKITSRFRKLVLQRQGIMKIIEGSTLDHSQLRKQQIEYDEIANDIRLNTMHSKVVDLPHSHKPHDNLWHNMNESESLMVASPATDKKHSSLKGLVGSSPQKEAQNALSGGGSKFKKGDSPESLLPQQQVGQLDCIEEQAMIKSIKKLREGEQSQNVNFASSRQVEVNLNRMQQQQAQPMATIQQSQALTVEKVQNSRVSQQRRHQKIIKLHLQTNILDQQIIGRPILPPAEKPQSLEQELAHLRSTVRELRLEKVKAIASKELIEEEQKANLLQGHSQRQRKISGQHYSTIINALSIDSQSQRALTTQKSDSLPINFGRIRKNRSSQKPSLSFQLVSNRPLINISKLSTTSKNRVLQATGERNRLSSSGRSKQYKTLNLAKIAEENMQESNCLTVPFRLSKPTDYSLDAAIQKSSEMRTKLMDKLEADDKKFQKFLIREQAKSRSRVRRYQSDIPDNIAEHQHQQSLFEGTIVKNIVSPFYSSDQFRLSRCPEAEFLPKNIISLIERYQTRTIRRNHTVPIISLPRIPPHPHHNTSTQQIMDLILQILPLSDETYNENELQGCSLKKYKNCLMFELSNNIVFRIVWYYTGKLYMGEWNPDKNEKQGEGIQYIPNKYYYKGSFINGKRYGKGVLVQNSSIYDGQFINGLKEGRGRFYDSQDSSYFEGQWRNNKVQGKGYSECQGNFYQGSFKDGMKSGFGVQVFANGDKYCGEYNNDKFQGYGKYSWADGAEYIGSFRDGYRHDYGKWVSGSDSPQIYTGFYTKDKKHGSGRYVWSNGCVYEGHFENDFKHGIGSVQYPDGQYMEGVWAQGILTDVISKLSEANQEPPLDEPKSREYHSHTRIRIMEVQNQ